METATIIMPILIYMLEILKVTHIMWCYNEDDENGTVQTSWIELNDLVLIYISQRIEGRLGQQDGRQNLLRIYT